MKKILFAVLVLVMGLGVFNLASAHDEAMMDSTTVVSTTNANGDVVIKASFAQRLCHIMPFGLAKRLDWCNRAITPDTTAPVISNISVSDVDDDSATIRWSANEFAKGTIYYSVNPGFGTGDANVTATNTEHMWSGHNMDLDNLSASTTYYFRIKAVDPAGNSSLSDQNSFTTLATGSVSNDDESDDNDDDEDMNDDSGHHGWNFGTWINTKFGHGDDTRIESRGEMHGDDR